MTDLVDRARALAPTLAERERGDRAGAPRAGGPQRSRSAGGLLPHARAGGGRRRRGRTRASSRRRCEELARGDAAAAWVVMTGSTTGLLLAYLDEGTRAPILDARPEAALAGVFAPTGRAVPEGDGYRVSGRWAYGSGCENAELAHGRRLGLWRGRAAAAAERRAGDPLVLLPRRRLARCSTPGDVGGLRGTGSHDIVVEDVLRARRSGSCCVMADAPRHDGALYRFPVFGLLSTGVASVGLGIARRRSTG